MTPRAGVRLDGRYELTKQIAVGGMGQVWAGIELTSRRQVAIKVLRPEFAGEQLFLDRIAAEARNSHVLEHPGIARTYDHGVVDGLGYLVMEFVYGEPLSEVLTREGTLGPRRVLDIMAQTSDALAVAHAAGVVHRDIKPANLLISGDGAVTITDFGISIAANQAPMTAAGMVMGTAQYLPPEQAMGRPATGAGDIYALGIIAYEALVGHRPFTGATQVDIAFAHVTEQLPPLPGTVDLPIRILVEGMLSKDPADRPASAQRVAARARELLAGHGPWEPERAAEAWPPTRAAAPTRRREPTAPDTQVPTTSGPIPAIKPESLPVAQVPSSAVPVLGRPARGAHASEAPPDTGMIRRRRRGAHAAASSVAAATVQDDSATDHVVPVRFGSTGAAPTASDQPLPDGGRASGPNGRHEAPQPAREEAEAETGAISHVPGSRRRRRRDTPSDSGGIPATGAIPAAARVAPTAPATEAAGRPLPSRRSLRKTAARAGGQFVVGFTAVMTASVTTLALGLGGDLGQSGEVADDGSSIGVVMDEVL